MGRLLGIGEHGQLAIAAVVLERQSVLAIDFERAAERADLVRGRRSGNRLREVSLLHGVERGLQRDERANDPALDAAPAHHADGQQGSEQNADDAETRPGRSELGLRHIRHVVERLGDGGDDRVERRVALLRPVLGCDDGARALAELADQLVHAAIGGLDLGGDHADLADEFLADARAGAQLPELGEARVGGATQLAELAKLASVERLAGAEDRAQQRALRAVVGAHAPAGGFEALQIGEDRIGQASRVRGRGRSRDERALDRADAVIPGHRRGQAALCLGLCGFGVEILAAPLVALLLRRDVLDKGGAVRQVRRLQPRYRLGDPRLVGLLDLADDGGGIVRGLNARLSLSAIGADGIAGQQQGPVGLHEIGEAHIGPNLHDGLLRHIAQRTDAGHAEAGHRGHEIVLDRGGEEFHGEALEATYGGEGGDAGRGG